MYWPFVPIFMLFFAIFLLYPGIMMAPSEELRRFSLCSLMGHLVIIISGYIENTRLNWVTIALTASFFISVIILLTVRSITRHILSKINFSGIPAVIYGGQNMGRTIIDKLLNKNELGYVPVLILDDDKEASGEEYRGVPVIHNTNLGPEIAQCLDIKTAIVAISHIKRKDLVHLVNHSVSAFRYNILIPDFFGITTIWMSVRDMDGIFGLASSQKLKIPMNSFIKRFLDISVVITGGLVILPFLLIITLLIRITSKGPALYTQNRIGLKGKEFKTYKFRTMVLDSDKQLQQILEKNPKIREEWNSSQKIKDDPRITKFGRFLRKTSLDEFPQLINVLRGEMSLVGPRPIVQNEISKYGEDFERIFSVKPGITGLWQVSGRSDTCYADRISFDTYYLQNWSIWMDLWVLYRTISVVLKRSGAY
jgi:Undecaprenyl-phosphate galactose phosphotransferase WbaP